MAQPPLSVDVGRRSLFRDLNLRVKECIDSIEQGPTDSYELLCECGRPDCRERVRIGRDTFAELVAREDRYVVAPGHEAAADDLVARPIAA